MSEQKKKSSKAVVLATWDDVPHLDDQAKQDMLESMMPHQRDARSKGIPALGSGAIYPIPETDIVVDPFKIPAYWPKAYGLDVGWNRTACIWGALDRESDILYLYSEYYRGQAEPVVHSAGIQARGDWIHGAIDPASRGRGQKDGSKLLQDYKDLGLQLHPADNAVESGLHNVWLRLSTGRLKVFKTLNNWLSEYRIYRRDEKGAIVKEFDHLMDATRYLIKTGILYAKVKPVSENEETIYGHTVLDDGIGY